MKCPQYAAITFAATSDTLLFANRARLTAPRCPWMSSSPLDMGRLDLLRTAKQNGVPLMAKPPFSVAVIDPPWPYCATSKGKDKPKTAGAAKLSGYSDSIYRTHSMPIGELAALRISELVSDHIFLWTTAPF